MRPDPIREAPKVTAAPSAGFDPLKFPDKAGEWPRYIVELVRYRRWLAVPILAAILLGLFGVWWVVEYGKPTFERWIAPPYFTGNLTPDYWHALEGEAPTTSREIRDVLRIPAETFLVYDRSHYRLRDYSGHFRVELKPDQQSVTWVIRARSKNHYFAVRCKFLEKDYAFDTYVFKNGREIPCLPRPLAWPMIPLRKNDSLHVSNLTLAKLEGVQSVTIDRNPGLTAEEVGERRDITGRPVQVPISICDQSLDDGQFGFKAKGQPDAYVVYEYSLTGMKGN